ncbi:MAG: ABC transporter ATP-binding protein [Acidimicrobiaceae bacterium]|nr:ABC transporter ATP-binding protein [Acidimicrobiaceae bacterium]
MGISQHDPQPNLGRLHPDHTLGWIRRIWPIAALRRKLYMLAIFAGLLASAATALVPLVVGQGINAAAAGSTLNWWALLLLLLAVVGFCCRFAYRYALFRLAHHVEADLRNLIFEHLTEMSFEYWDRTQTGQVISRANSDVRSVQLMFAFLPLVFIQGILLVMGVVSMLLMSPKLTLIALTSLPFVFFVGMRLRNKVLPLSWVVQERMAEIATVISENVEGAQLVRAFVQESNQIKLLARSARRLRWAATAVADTRARYGPLIETLPRFALAFVLLTGGLMAIDGSIGVGEIVAFNAYMVIITRPFMFAGFVLVQYQKAAAAAQRIFEILDRKPDIHDPEPSCSSRYSGSRRLERGRVSFEDVTFTYSGRESTPVLVDFCLDISPGEMVALVGRVGSGKSTVARLLPRFYDVDSGSVRMDGLNVKQAQLDDLRRAVVVVPDEPFLFASSVRYNVTFANPEAGDAKINEALQDAAALDFVMAMPQGLETVLKEKGADLSGGQRQRLAIARAFLADPAVLVIDDATSAIDTRVEQRLYTALRLRRSNRTTIIISHRLSTVAQASRVIFMSEGRVAADGDHRRLLEDNTEYAEVLTQPPGVTSQPVSANIEQPSYAEVLTQPPGATSVPQV